MAADDKHGPTLGRFVLAGQDHSQVAQVIDGRVQTQAGGSSALPSSVLQAEATAVTAGAVVFVAPVASSYINILSAVVSSPVQGRFQWVSYTGSTAVTLGSKISYGAGGVSYPPGPSQLYRWERTASTGVTFGIHFHTASFTAGNGVTVNALYDTTAT